MPDPIAEYYAWSLNPSCSSQLKSHLKNRAVVIENLEILRGKKRNTCGTVAQRETIENQIVRVVRAADNKRVFAHPARIGIRRGPPKGIIGIQIPVIEIVRVGKAQGLPRWSAACVHIQPAITQRNDVAGILCA